MTIDQYVGRNPTYWLFFYFSRIWKTDNTLGRRATTILLIVTSTESRERIRVLSNNRINNNEMRK
jgi:hypothetical protein